MRLHRDPSNVPLPFLTKRELRALVVRMRLRHSDEVRELLAMLEPEQQLAWLTRDRSKAAA